MKISKKNIAGIIICLLIGTGIIPGIHGATEGNEKTILDEIEGIQNKILTVDEIIGGRHVKYWAHKIDDIYVKNDYILLHQDIENNTILKYEKKWTDLDSSLSYSEEEIFEPQDYLWKKKVVFPDETDKKYFYTFSTPQEYPSICWEVRHTDGTTIMYNLEGEEIGQGIPAPFNGFSLSGFHEDSYPDPWLNWRLNANSWFTNWCDITVSISHPTPATISSYISDPDYELFFELAHGASTYFKATKTEYYYASDVADAISGRSPMRFAFIGSCGGMDNTGPGTFSYEFRKGQMTETVTVGYTGMATCPGWSVSLEWQDLMFYSMDAGYTIKEAFDTASAEYPTIAPCVVFVGDVTIKIRVEDEDDEDHGIPPNVLITYPKNEDIVSGTINITGTAMDLDGQVEHVYLQINEGNWLEAEGTKSWYLTWDTTAVDDGVHTIIAVAVDNSGLQSGCAYVTVNVSNTIIIPLEVDANGPYSGYIDENIQFTGSATGGIPPYSWHWNFDDGYTTSEQNPTHAYTNPRSYTAVLTVTDSKNNTASNTTLVHITGDTTPPTVKITKPEKGLYINDEMITPFFTTIIINSIEIQTKAVDTETGINRVEFYIDNEKKAIDTTPPYTWIWDETSLGKSLLKVIAYDNQENSAIDEIMVWKFF